MSASSASSAANASAITCHTCNGTGVGDYAPANEAGSCVACNGYRAVAAGAAHPVPAGLAAVMAAGNETRESFRAEVVENLTAFTAAVFAKPIPKQSDLRGLAIMVGHADRLIAAEADEAAFVAGVLPNGEPAAPNGDLTSALAPAKVALSRWCFEAAAAWPQGHSIKRAAGWLYQTVRSACGELVGWPLFAAVREADDVCRGALAAQRADVAAAVMAAAEAALADYGHHCPALEEAVKLASECMSARGVDAAPSPFDALIAVYNRTVEELDGLAAHQRATAAATERTAIAHAITEFVKLTAEPTAQARGV